MRLSQKFALAVFISMIILAVCMLCFAEEEWNGLKVDDDYILENGEECTVTKVMADGVRCSTKLYKQRKQEEAEEIKYKGLYDGLVEEREKDEAERQIEKLANLKHTDLIRNMLKVCIILHLNMSNSL